MALALPSAENTILKTLACDCSDIDLKPEIDTILHSIAPSPTVGDELPKTLDMTCGIEASGDQEQKEPTKHHSAQTCAVGDKLLKSLDHNWKALDNLAVATVSSQHTPLLTGMMALAKEDCCRILDSYQNTCDVVEQSILLIAITDLITCVCANSLTYPLCVMEKHRKGLKSLLFLLPKQWKRFFTCRYEDMSEHQISSIIRLLEHCVNRVPEKYKPPTKAILEIAQKALSKLKAHARFSAEYVQKEPVLNEDENSSKTDNVPETILKSCENVSVKTQSFPGKKRKRQNNVSSKGTKQMKLKDTCKTTESKSKQNKPHTSEDIKQIELNGTKVKLKQAKPHVPTKGTKKMKLNNGMSKVTGNKRKQNILCVSSKDTKQKKSTGKLKTIDAKTNKSDVSSPAKKLQLQQLNRKTSANSVPENASSSIKKPLNAFSVLMASPSSNTVHKSHKQFIKNEVGIKDGKEICPSIVETVNTSTNTVEIETSQRASESNVHFEPPKEKLSSEKDSKISPNANGMVNAFTVLMGNKKTQRITHKDKKKVSVGKYNAKKNNAM